MVLVDRLSRFPLHKENLAIEVCPAHPHIHFSNDRLNIIRGAIECNPMQNTLYYLTFNEWSDCLHHIPKIA